MARGDEIVKERLKKLDSLRKADINPYPNKFDFKDYTRDLQETHKKLKKEQKSKTKATIAGRLMSFRDLGKIAFGTLRDSTGDIQIMLQSPDSSTSVFQFFKKYIDSGDFLGIQGILFRTKRGELSIIVKSVKLLSKSILPLPEKFHGLQDEEERLRKRYLDILLNPDVKFVFLRKAKFWNAIRNFLIERGFIEVETPVLETSAGGAAATPFETHHNALDIPVYLRISMGELWQKRLMVAGFDKTFEIGRQFRNEGMDSEHLQDYSQMEFYWAYANYEDGMSLVKELYKEIAKSVFKTTKFKRGEHSFDLSKPWKTIDYSSEIKKQTKIDIFKASKQDIEKKLSQLNEPFESGLEKPRLIDILWKFCRRKISGPAFLTGQPVEISPLAKRSHKDPRKVEQFQVILAGSEVGNGYSELNDPQDQESRFQEQQRMQDAGDSDAQSHDKDFVEALKHGMPPTCGFGFSERLFSFLEGKPIRETVIFPLMKPTNLKELQESSKTQKQKGGKS
jgi:lysyl-tRNA synthetase, class II